MTTREKQTELISSDIFNFDGRDIGRYALTRYSETPWGKHQAGQKLRYSLWAYDRDTMLKDIGISVHPLLHGLDVEKNVIRTLLETISHKRKSLDISRFELIGLIYAAQMHDLGENTHPDFKELFGWTVGDMPRGQKTDKHRKLEKSVLTMVLQTHFNYLPDGLLQFVLDLSTHEPNAESSLAGRVLEVSHERAETITCMTAGGLGQLAIQAEELNRRTLALLGIGQRANVPRVSLEAAIDEFRPLDKWLEDTQLRCDRYAAVTI